ncbi:MAG: high-potential iron-sulfur protein [Gammaproteobacteria bacterium]
MNKPEVSRRRFLAQVAIAVPAGAALLDAAMLNTASAQAALPNLALDDPSAKALLYVDDASKVDRKNPLAARFTPDQNCSNCSQIQGKAGDAHRPCAIFPGKLVASKGWCSVWAKKV